MNKIVLNKIFFSERGGGFRGTLFNSLITSEELRTSIHSRAFFNFLKYTLDELAFWNSFSKFQLKRGFSHPGYWRSNAGTCDRVFLFQLIIECIIPINKGFHSLGLTDVLIIRLTYKHLKLKFVNISLKWKLVKEGWLGSGQLKN